MKLGDAIIKNGVKITLCHFGSVEMERRFEESLSDRKENNIHIQGFQYLSSIDVGVQGMKSGYQFITASIEEELVGVLLFARLGSQQEVCIEGGSLNLFYIDVKESWREKGIAKSLLEGWNQYIEKTSSKQETIVLSYETELGKKANIHEMGRSILINQQVITD